MSSYVLFHVGHGSIGKLYSVYIKKFVGGGLVHEINLFTNVNS